MAQTPEPIRILALAIEEMQDDLNRRIASIGFSLIQARNAHDLVHRIREGEGYEVILLPATLPQTDDWWEIWGELVTLSPKPAILVHTHAATFQLWSAVLELGGYDVIDGSLNDEQLRQAITRAAESTVRTGTDEPGEC